MGLSRKDLAENIIPVAFDPDRLGAVLMEHLPEVDITRVRNLIVHQYEEIDPAILFDLAKNRLNDFRKFRDEIDTLESF